MNGELRKNWKKEHMLFYVAQTEREFIRQRQGEGIAAAKAQGIQFGRRPMKRPAEYEEIKTRWEKRELSARAAAKELGLHMEHFALGKQREWVNKYKFLYHQDIAFSNVYVIIVNEIWLFGELYFMNQRHAAKASCLKLKEILLRMSIRSISMKIKLAVLDRDARYLDRIEKAFGSKYEDKFELYTFTDMKAALNTLEPARIEVLLASDSFEINTELLPKRCGFAYLVDAQDVMTFRDQRAICKFQKADLFYKQILMVYSENAERMGFRTAGDGSRIILFTGVGGGVGTSTMAAACALHFADQKQKVLYLNLERFGSADLFFHGEGQFNMSDVIFALKSKRPNLGLKLEGSVRQDPRGVHFYSASKIALDMMELNTEDVHDLLAALSRSGYNYIIIDADFSLEKEMLKVYREAHAVVLVGNGTENSNLKTERALAALQTMEHNADMPLINRVSFLYNKVSSKGSKEIQAEQIRVLGGTPVYAAASTEQLLDQLRHLDAFNKIL